LQNLNQYQQQGNIWQKQLINEEKEKKKKSDLFFFLFERTETTKVTIQEQSNFEKIE
jgi:hypothetical protein